MSKHQFYIAVSFSGPLSSKSKTNSKSPHDKNALNLLLLQVLRQRRDLLTEQLLGIRPDALVLAVVQGEQRRLEALAKGLGGLAGQHRGQVVDADDGERRRVLVVLDGDGDGGVVKGGVDGVDGDGVVWVGRVARDVDDDAEVAAGLGEEFVVDKGRDGGVQVNLSHR